MTAAFRQALRTLGRRVQMLIGRGIVRSSEERRGRSLLQVSIMQGETRSDLEHAQAFGFASRPPAGAEAIVLFIGGNRDHGVVIATADRRSRPQVLAPGEVALYHPSGSRVLLREDGAVIVESAMQVVLSTPSVRVEGDLVVTGDVTDRSDSTGVSMFAMRTAYNAHTHPGGGPPNPQMIGGGP